MGFQKGDKKQTLVYKTHKNITPKIKRVSKDKTAFSDILDTSDTKDKNQENNIEGRKTNTNE